MAECGRYRRLTWAHAQLLAATFDKLTKHLHEAQQVLLERWAGRHRPPEVVGPHLEGGSSNLNEALIWHAICPKQDGGAGEAFSPDNPHLNPTALRASHDIRGDPLD
jgi:hypothetical protein